MRMSAEKTERLINLTLGLLATKRYLTKNEIFRTIAGYSGTMESMERMFERDKDELRGAGIEIEVGGLDPLFEDEQGYLIRSGSIQIQPDDFTKQELMLMVMSANYWINSNLTESAKHALLKISSLDAAAVAQIDGGNKIISPNLPDHSASQIQLLIQGISERIYVKFSYRGSMREIAPIKLENLQGFWYLTGLEGNLLKRFKVIRFETSVELSGRAGAFDIMNSSLSEKLTEDVLSQKIRLIAKIRIGKCNNLRRIGDVVPLDLEWDKCEIEVADQEMILREILWNGDDIQVLEPENVREIVLARLELISQ
jgi:proteasome accessory factor B